MSIGSSTSPARPAAVQPHEAAASQVDLDLLAAVVEDLDDRDAAGHPSVRLWTVDDLGEALTVTVAASAPALAA
ncbi:hypothetical protein [Nocardioides sp. GY 10127]|uniref:hypothetical protein n=1 Tax=Nocardioides sp. GY 10127 TaxID=2569762 RepID=UPI0010A93C27|nr:hypothetical protein [Nocardioides sp. GY 10127]TIC81759.1 hypothetical protein E8D37_11270 [Nocardioides sp. GY 10127]